MEKINMNAMQRGKKFLSDLKLYSDYLKWIEDKNRYETWEEACESIIDGHRRKYSHVNIEEYLSEAEKAMKEMLVLGSQRNLQYRYPQIMKNNERMFNCVGVLFDKNEYFHKCFHILLSGCGLDFSLRKKFVDKLSPIYKRDKGTKTYVIEDSIEGWSDALGVLMSSYLGDNQPFPEYAGYEIKFDYSRIRPKGSYISGGFRAPGHEGLKQSLERIESLIERWIDTEGNKMRGILVYDIIMHAADAVLSGGVRRSACSIIIDEDDYELIHAKTGRWRHTNPQRARSNNAVGLIRNKFTYEKLKEIISLNEGDNDISFVFVHDEYEVSNPCIPGDELIATSEGLYTPCQLLGKEFYSLLDGETNYSEGFDVTGYQEVIGIKMRSGRILRVTKNHLIMDSLSGWNRAEYYRVGDLVRISDNSGYNHKVDRESDDFEKGYLIGTFEEGVERILTTELCTGSYSYLSGLLCGYFDSGAVMDREEGKIILSSRIADNLRYIQTILTSFGIDSVIHEGEEEKPVFIGGKIYKPLPSSTLHISGKGVRIFSEKVGFRNEEKDKILKTMPEIYRDYPEEEAFTDQIVAIESMGKMPTYDCSVKNVEAFSSQGVCIHNCREITFRPVLEDGRSGFQMCNLCEINGSKCITESEFYRACRAAAILGTLQAGYTDFPYLGKDTEDIVRREALLGVSITGWMNQPSLFNPQMLRTGARIVIDTNRELAKIIGINPSARTTTVKPSGNSSVILGTSSGIHPEHSEQYFRVMQLNKETETARYLEENMPFLLEESVWSATNSDYAVFIPITNPRNGLFKKDVKGVKHLEMIKMVQENWVNAGTNVENCLKPWLRHSVSCTVIIDNKEEITRYIYENQDYFKAVSFISDYGDKDFNQAPFTSVLTMEEIVKEYGDGCLLASGLIVDGLHAFDQNLWEACDLVLDSEKKLKITGTRQEVWLKKDWINRAKKFAKNYFKGDLKKMVYCLKDIHLFHKWKTINRMMKDVDFGHILGKPLYRDITDYSSTACSGKDSCEITSI